MCQWEFLGVGSVGGQLDECNLGSRPNVCLRMIGNMPEPDYLKLVSECDVGLSLMVSPHPSLPPFDFAAAGLVTVTNSFATKTPALLEEVSGNFIVAKPYVAELVEALRQSVARADNIAERKRHAKLKWPTKWDDPQCYGEPLLKRMRGWLKRKKKLW